MKSNSQTNKLENAPVLYSTEEVAKIFNVSIRTIQNWRDKGQINFSQINSVIVYQKKDIDELIEKSRIKAQAWKH
ncbi:MAG: helix-turn-helix domain-containing protein [Bacteroidia bacterium]